MRAAVAGTTAVGEGMSGRLADFIEAVLEFGGRVALAALTCCGGGGGTGSESESAEGEGGLTVSDVGDSLVRVDGSGIADVGNGGGGVRSGEGRELEPAVTEAGVETGGVSGGGGAGGTVARSASSATSCTGCVLHAVAGTGHIPALVVVLGARRELAIRPILECGGSRK
jgi:hypothetical protein